MLYIDAYVVYCPTCEKRDLIPYQPDMEYFRDSMNDNRPAPIFFYCPNCDKQVTKGELEAETIRAHEANKADE